MLSPTLLVAVVASFAGSGTTWTVDDDGPADFTTIQDAIDAAGNGDVVLVQSGSYDGFALTKALAIVGPASGSRPQVLEPSTVDAAPAFTIAGLVMHSLRVIDVPGPSAIDDCVLFETENTVAALWIERCDQVLVSSCTIDLDATCGIVGEGQAVYANKSSLHVVDSFLRGARGCETETAEYGDGGNGLYLIASEAVVTRTDLYGNVPAYSQPCCGFCTDRCDGAPGRGIRAAGGEIYGGPSVLHLRGTGNVADGWLEAPAAYLFGDSSLVHSGVDLQGGIELVGPLNGTVIHAVPSEPVISLTGDHHTGATKRLLLYGPAGQPALLLGSAGPGLVSLPSLQLDLWVDPLQLLIAIPVTTIGQTTPTALTTKVPTLAGIEGSSIHLQAVFPGIPGSLDPSTMVTTNSVALVFRF